MSAPRRLETAQDCGVDFQQGHRSRLAADHLAGVMVGEFGQVEDACAQVLRQAIVRVGHVYSQGPPQLPVLVHGFQQRGEFACLDRLLEAEGDAGDHVVLDAALRPWRGIVGRIGALRQGHCVQPFALPLGMLNYEECGARRIAPRGRT